MNIKKGSRGSLEAGERSLDGVARLGLSVLHYRPSLVPVPPAVPRCRPRTLQVPLPDTDSVRVTYCR